ncbi:MAG: FHA domain-containing protein [Phycisphaerae bacterium]|nr:FHA domain-containing protein [Phycisphaerae bacterium]
MDVHLIMFKTNGQQKSIPITKPQTVLGRGADCDLRIPIESCSRRQCQLVIRGEEVRLQDLGSSNGTYVNNNRVEDAVLKPGDKLMIGPITMTVRINGVPAEIKESPSAMANMDDVGGELIGARDDGSSASLLELADSSDADIAEDEEDPLAELAAAGGTVVEDDPLAALESLVDNEEEEK